MNFCRFFALGGEVHPSRLAQSDFMKFVTEHDVATEQFIRCPKEVIRIIILIKRIRSFDGQKTQKQGSAAS